MPRQNRVTPFGDIIAVEDRGTFLGNRGVLHDADGGIQRACQVKRWIVCLLEFRGRTRKVMTPGRYTELFFLDEATALAAGHRPCAECRHARFLDFCNAWKITNPSENELARPTAAEIDDFLHAERLSADRSKLSFSASLEEMPNGVFVTVQAWGDAAYLVLDDSLMVWTPGGYRERRRRPKGKTVQVLTPRSTVRTIEAGYVPDIHSSAF